MKCYIVDSFMGFFAYGEDLKLISAKTFEDSVEAVGQIADLEKSGSSPLLEGFLGDLVKMGYAEFVCEDELEAKSIKTRFGVEASVMTPSAGGRAFRSSLPSAATSMGVPARKADGLLKEASESLLKMKVRIASEKRDRLVAQAVTAMDEIDKNINISVSRVREWYGLHFPELDTLVPDHRQYMQLVVGFGNKSNMDEKGVNRIVQSDNKAKAIVETAKKSMGAEIGGVDLALVKSLAESELAFYTYRDSLEKYIDETMKDVAPNLRELIGAGLGGRLIALTGSLEGLAKKPASTVQVMGAEKALFRSLKTGARPPKHGIIFQHQDIHSAPRWQRGKIARALAGKISIAARVDSFGGEFVAASLKESLERRLADIRKKYSKPPERERRPERDFRRDRAGGRDFRRDRFGKRDNWDHRQKWRRDKKWRR
jgi:nucleolar protein 56